MVQPWRAFESRDMKTGGSWTLPAGLTGQGLRFVLVGSLAMVTQLGLYTFLAGSVGAQLANICAWLVSALIGNAAHHRFTFQVAGHAGESDHVVGLLTSLAGLGLSSLVLAMLDQPTGLGGTVAIVAVNAGVGALRFVALRWWLIGRATPATAPVLSGRR